jgi:hypothetical protein
MRHVFYWSVAENKKMSQADSIIRESIGLNPNSTLGRMASIIVELGRVRIDRLHRQVLQSGKIVLPEGKRRSHGSTAKGL